MIKKGLAVAVILLFIGVAFAPSINAEIESNESTYTDFLDDGSLSGYVYDTNMEPIEGALVRVHFHETYEENYTNSYGYYHVTNIPICWCMKNCTASKEDYVTEWVYLSIGESTTYNFVLEQDDSDLVELEVEFCGLGKKRTVQLTQQEAEEVTQLFDEIRTKIDNVESRDEAIVIFKEAIVELDKYGLLGGLSVRQAKQIVTENYEIHKLMRLLKTIYQKYKGTIDENRNLLCFIVGATNGTNFDSQLELFFGRILVLLSFIGPIFFNSRFPLYTIFILGYFLLDFFNSFNPMTVASRINLGGEMGGGWHPEFVDFYAHGWIVTTGLLGTQRYEGMMQGGLPLYGSGTISNGYIYAFSPGVLGFTGLHIYNPIQAKHFYLGSALWVNFEEV